MPFIINKHINRRSFIHTAFLGAAAVSVSGCRVLHSSSQKNQEYHTAFLSDTHIPGDRQESYRGFSPWKNLQQIVPQIIASHAQGLVLSGDAARLEGKVDDYRELHTLLDPVAQVMPLCIGLGNHDDRANFQAAFPVQPGFHPVIDGKLVTVIEQEVVRIIVLDSLLYVNKVAGLLGLAQRAWLASYLPQANDRPVILVFHHSLKDSDGDLLDVDRLFALIKPHRHVKAIVYGHSHSWGIEERQGVRLINLPASGYSFRDQDPVGWIEARFRRDGAALTLWTIVGNQSGNGRTNWIPWRG